MATNTPLLAALCEAPPDDVRQRRDVTAALRGVLIGAALQPREVIYEEFIPHPDEAEFVDWWLEMHPRLRYENLYTGCGFNLDRRTWFLMCLEWARRDLCRSRRCS